MSNTPKEYSNDEISIVWKKEKCIHSANCVRSLPGVFKPHERPWISIKNADTPHLKETIEKCPSGALTWKNVATEDFVKNVDEAVADSTKLSVFADGPILIKGNFEITDSSGNVLEKKDSVALCRCGASENKPFCDGAHKKIGFKG